MASLKWKLAVAVVLAAVGSVASATYLTCSETVNAQPQVTVEQFPSSLTFDLTVTDGFCALCATGFTNWACSACPASYGAVAGESDATLEALLLAPIPWVTTNPPWVNPFPFALWNGASVTTSVTATLPSYAACATWGRNLSPQVLPGDGGVIVIHDAYRVTWDVSGVPPYYAECSAQVTCLPPLGPTRTLGYFKTHPAATAACVAGGPIDLGFLTIAQGDTTAALGLLGASPAKYADGTKRSALDQARVLLARQLLVAVCNGRVFGSSPSDSGTIPAAVAALAGRSCTSMNWLQGQLDAFNNSGDTGDNWFGSAAPGTYPDPTTKTSATCL